MPRESTHGLSYGPAQTWGRMEARRGEAETSANITTGAGALL